MVDKVTLYSNPMSRGRTVQWLLDELGAPYDLKVLDLAKGEQKTPQYLAINPMGKVPAIVHRGVVVTEAAAICVYLADAFPQAGLAPKLDESLYPNPPESASGSTALKERTRALVSARLDRMIPGYLQP